MSANRAPSPRVRTSSMPRQLTASTGSPTVTDEYDDSRVGIIACFSLKVIIYVGYLPAFIAVTKNKQSHNSDAVGLP